MLQFKGEVSKFEGLTLVPEDSRVSYQAKVVMSCVGAGNQTAQNITFKRNGDKITNSSKVSITSKHAVDRIGELDVYRYESTLSICDFDAKSLGTYSCAIENDLLPENANDLKHSESWTISYDNATRPIEIVEYPKDQISDLGGSLEMTCSATGILQPTITFSKNGQVLQNSATMQVESTEVSRGETVFTQATLTLHLFGTNDVGEYTCTAINSETAESESWTIRIPIPATLVSTPEKILYAEDETVVRMICTGTGFPLPSISFNKSNTPVNTSSNCINFSQTTTTTELGIVLSQATLDLICSSGDEDNSGRYSCTANNSIGYETQWWNVSFTGILYKTNIASLSFST